MIDSLTAEEALEYVRKRKALLDNAVVTRFEIEKLKAKLLGINNRLTEMDRELRSETPKLVIK